MDVDGILGPFASLPNYFAKVQLVSPNYPPLADCRYCSEASRASGEAPIGTIGSLHHWIAITLPRQRSRQIWEDRPLLHPLAKLPRSVALRRGEKVRLVAIASTEEEYDSDRVRVIHYFRPPVPFAQFSQAEYLLPETKVVPLIRNRLFQSPHPDPFQDYRQIHTDPVRDLFVCTHTRYDLACGRYGTPLYQLLCDTYHSNSQLRVWESSHFGGHRFAPTMMDFPTGQCWGHLVGDRLEITLAAIIERQGDYQLLRSVYRGWAGTHKFGQLLDCDLWMQMGWEWLSYQRTAQVVQTNLSGVRQWAWHLLGGVPWRRAQTIRDGLAMTASQVDVEMEYYLPGGPARSARARIEQCGHVATMAKSDANTQVIVPQYRLSMVSSN